MLVNFTDQGLKGVKDVHYEAPNDEVMAKFVMTLSSFGNLRTTVMRAWDESEHLPLIRELS
jgi:uncharacterized protein with GYD domain